MRAILRAAFFAGVPVLLGYTTIGFAFGLLAAHAGYPWFVATAMSIFVYAGASQFIGIGLFAAGAGLVEITAVTALVNARHAVYGLSMLDRYRGAGAFKPYLVFALTDETYGLLTTVRPPDGVDGIRFSFALSLLNQCYWVVGSTVGALVGRSLPFDLTGLEFSLTALFVVLLVEQIRSVPRPAPYLIATAAAAVSFALVPGTNALLLALGAAVGLLGLLRGRFG